jgi:F-type H+-transporting ATPase subunit delta
MKITKQARREAKQLFRGCLVNGVFDENRARQAIAQVLQARPRGFLAVLNHFQRLIKLECERRMARVESAAPLDAAQKAVIQSSLLQRYGPGLSFEFSQRPDLLGGVRVQVGSDVYDGSIRTRLNEVREAFESA